MGKYQHGFKKTEEHLNPSPAIAIPKARALDKDNYVIMASLDLSAAFDIVNTDLLLMRL